MKSVTLESLPALARALAEESLAWMEPYGDAACDLLRYPGRAGHYASLDVETEQPHLVRESVWWAIGLLLRNKHDDAARAERILEAVLRWQFHEPGTPYHGTFHRAPEEELPSLKKSVMWADYDPNWRQFIGTSFLVILEKLSDRLSHTMQSRLKDSIRMAVEGETPERIAPEYSNIAMMQAVLLVYAGAVFDQPAWKEKGVQLAREVYELFAEHETFSEYNSPTYYGVILYGLRLWRLEFCGPELREWGAKMEAALWRHIARCYNPGLRNICGPFDRAYGMDMTKYVAGIGIWMRLELESKQAPAPKFADDFNHRHDFVMAPVVALLGTDLPAELRPQLTEIPKRREFSQVIETKPATRVATVFMQPDRMWGAESGSTVCWSQFHAATAHWLQPDGTLAWMRLENEMLVDAVASADGIKVIAANGASSARLIWHLSVSGRPLISREQWRLPGMIVRVKTNLPAPALAAGEASIQTLTYEISPLQKASLELEFLPEKS